MRVLRSPDNMTNPGVWIMCRTYISDLDEALDG
jgi:hypothetical protein